MEGGGVSRRMRGQKQLLYHPLLLTNIKLLHTQAMHNVYTQSFWKEVRGEPFLPKKVLPAILQNQKLKNN